MKHTTYPFLAILVVALVFGSGIPARAQGEITLMAAGPTRRPTERIVANFQAKTGLTVNVTFVNGVATRQMVARGQPQDVSLIIAPFPAAVASRTIDVSSATPVASLVWVLAVPTGALAPDISTPDAVRKALLAAKSIGYEDPDFTVAGQGPWEALTTLGIADQVAAKSKIELGPGSQGIDLSATDAVVKTITRLEDGNIDIALHDLNDLIANQDNYQIVGVLPREIATPTPIVGFLSTRAKDNADAKALLQYLASPEAQVIWKEGGLGAPEKWPMN